MLVLLVAVALAALGGAALLANLPQTPPAAWAHLGFAAGVMPLIFGAMGHFVPVLTRSRQPAITIAVLQGLTFAAGALAVTAFALPGAPPWSLHVAAGLGLAAALMQSAWILRRARVALGAPHPGIHWYLAASLCLALALAAALAMPLFPAQRTALRLFHLHLNTLGFVGLTAIGTLQVLVPTAAGRGDPASGQRLRRHLLPAAAGALLTAIGAATVPELAYVGAILFAWPLLAMIWPWWRGFKAEVLRLHGAAPSLFLASKGLAAMVLAGIAHGAGWMQGRPAILAFVLAFLLPLVSGAASQLLPIWLRPGLRTPWHDALRARLSWLGGVRAALMLAGGALVALGAAWGTWLAAAGFGLFVLALARAGFHREIDSGSVPQEKERRP